MRRHGYCSQNADLPVHLVKRFFAKTPCGQSEWIWNTPYRVPNSDVKAIDAAALTEITGGGEWDVRPTSDTSARSFGDSEVVAPTDGGVTQHNGVAPRYLKCDVITISVLSFLLKSACL